MKTKSRIGVLFAVISLALSCLLAPLAGAGQSPEPLNGNWAVRTPNNDGTFRTTYLNLKQEGSRITGTIRVTQFYYRITDNTGGPEGFVLNASMMDGKSERKVQYEGKLVGAELHLSTRRRPQDNPTQMVAVRRACRRGALPARNPLPALHKVPDNGLARTPPMGWNSWNKFASRVDDATVRSYCRRHGQ
jgi:alpha-galactosidase